VTALRGALLTPLSGPLAIYGRAGAAALGLWAEHAAASLPTPWTTIDLEVVDAYPSAAAAMGRVLTHEPHVVFGPYGSGPAMAALEATDALVWNHGAATDRLRRPAFANVVNVLAPASSYFAAVLEAVQAWDPAVRTVSLLHSATGFGREVARGAIDTARRLGMPLRSLQFAAGQASNAARCLAAGDVLLVVGSFEDEVAAAPRLLDRPWRKAAFVGAGVEEVLAVLGSAREGLLGPCQWLARAAPPPTDGPDAAWFVRAYRDKTAQEPPYPAAAAFAAGILWVRCLRQAGSADAMSVLAVANALATSTLFGSFRIDPHTGLQAGHQVLVVQWQHGRRRVVWPPERAERALV
jgi:branched-chain amino acid transport system substrate-binding protein